MILTDLSQSAIIKATEDNLFEFAHLFKVLPDATLYEGEDMTRLMIPSVKNPYFNGIWRAKLRDPEPQIRAAVEHFKLQHVPMFWWVDSETYPKDLGEILEKKFFTLIQDRSMALDLQQLNEVATAPASVRIEQIVNVEMLEEWIMTLYKTFGFNKSTWRAFRECYTTHGFGEDGPIVHFMGYLDDKPVATSSVFYGGGVAGIYNVSTIPEARRQGIGTLITRYPLSIARERGYRLSVLNSSKKGYSVYRWLGYQEYCKANMYYLTQSVIYELD